VSILLNDAGFPVNGWRTDLENFEHLEHIGDAHKDWQDAVSGLYSAPPVLNRRWLRTENQLQQGSCNGWSSSEAGEVCFNIASSGQVIQFSAQWNYIEAQRNDGLIGKDSGSTLTGASRAMRELGCCPENVWPYTGKYVLESPNGRAACLKAAAEFKIKTFVRLKSYQQIFDWLAGGLGSVWVGRRQDWGGGHATHLPGYTSRRDAKGRNYLDEHNSWGNTFGDHGWIEREPAHVDSWFADSYTVVLGASDMQLLKVRPVDFSRETIFKD
jgi:hypothetical protein